jgi:predicted amidohydrolase
MNKVMHHQPDLIVVTEVCDDPIGLNKQEMSDYYRVRGNQIQDFFASVAKDNQCYIAFGTQRQENGNSYNSCVVLDRKGNVAGIYNKNYPTIGEILGGTKPSTETPLIQCDFGTIAGAICFDLNFDELRDRTAALRPDVLLFLSQWHAGLEQGKWAYTSRAFFVCASAFRTFPSEIRNPFGEVIATSTHNYNYAVATVNRDRKIIHQDLNLAKLIELKKKYGDKVIITEQGEIGVLMITSEHEQVSAAGMVKEFGIELLDDYFERSKQTRMKYLQSK